MLQINIQNFGGRGADSGYGGSHGTGKDGTGSGKFYDMTKKFSGMSIHEFENAIRANNEEYIGIFDKNGNLIVAGTSHNKGSVSIPERAPGFSKAHTLTHNHPSNDNRIIGGSFSEADVQNHLRLGLKGETRAVAVGPNEHTYIFRAKKGAKQNPSGMARSASKVGNEYKSEAQKAINGVRKKLAQKGKSLNGKDNQVYIGTMKHLWKTADIDKYGYEYIESRKARW